MHTAIRTKQSARRATIGAQAAAMVLLLSGVVMAFNGLPGMELPKASSPAPADAQGGGQPAPAPAEQYVPALHPETVDEMLSAVKNHPVPDPVETADAGGETVEQPAEPAPGVRYVGSIRVGGRAAAFMNIDGVTKLLRPGGPEYGGVRLVSVDGDRVVVSVHGSGEQEIEKTARVGPPVSVVVGGAPEPAPEESPAASSEPPQRPSFTPDMSREERIQMLRDRARSERGRWERQRGSQGGPPNS